jgi:hypothetical protein
LFVVDVGVVEGLNGEWVLGDVGVRVRQVGYYEPVSVVFVHEDAVGGDDDLVRVYDLTVGTVTDFLHCVGSEVT